MEYYNSKVDIKKNGNNNGSDNPIKNLMKLPKKSDKEKENNNKEKIGYKNLARFLDVSERTIISWTTKENYEINHSYFISLCEFFNHKILPAIIRDICKEAFYICPSETVWCFVVLDDYHFTNVKQIVLFRNTAYRHFFRTDYSEKYLFFNDCIMFYSSDNNMVTKCLRSHEDIICTGSSEVKEENKKYKPENRSLFVNKQFSQCRIPLIIESKDLGKTGKICLSLDNRLVLNPTALKVWKKDKEKFFEIERVGEINEYKNGKTAYKDDEIFTLKELLEKKYTNNTLEIFFNSISALKKHTLKNDL